MPVKEMLNHGAMSVKKETVEQWEGYLRSKSTHCQSETAMKCLYGKHSMRQFSWLCTIGVDQQAASHHRLYLEGWLQDL